MQDVATMTKARRITPHSPKQVRIRAIRREVPDLKLLAKAIIALAERELREERIKNKLKV